VFATARRPEFAVLERACAILRSEGRLAGHETIVDVGAHIGTTTISALSQQGFVRAVAIEPDPDHLRLLRANVALNGLDERVTVVAAAMADTARLQRPFSQGSRREGAYRWMKGRLAQKPSPATIAVDTVTLDGLAEAGMVEAATTGLLWFDCGTCEERALESASTFLEHRVPIVFPLRQGRVSRAGVFLSLLEETYDKVVDLRSPRLAESVSVWRPTIRPVDDLVRLPAEGKKLTDVLLF
jgi:FkbM family methyltransferase